MKNLRLLGLLATFVFASCGSQIDMPRGSSKGYTSARLVNRNPTQGPITDATEKQVHGMIQQAIGRQFRSHGLEYGGSTADLAVAYLVIYQEPGMTAQYDEYFGYGRDAEAITDRAHLVGSVESDRPDYFQRAGVLVDVIDLKTNKLVYRNHAQGDVVRGASEGTRRSRIDAAVAQALADFFR